MLFMRMKLHYENSLSANGFCSYGKMETDEGRLLYLLSGSCEVLPSSYIKLRSYLNIHAAKLAEHQKVRIFKSRQTCCPYCFSAWTCDTSSFKLLPSKKLKFNKNEKNVNDGPDQEESRNVLVLKCKVCTKKSSFSLVKKKKNQEKVEKEEENVKHKKKKKKKDRSCGLLVNLEKTGAPSPLPSAAKKKSSLTPAMKTQCKTAMQTQCKTTMQKNSQKTLKKSPVNLPNPKCKGNPQSQSGKKVVNPFALEALNKIKQKKKQQKLKILQKAIKGGKKAPKKTLQDFLTLI